MDALSALLDGELPASDEAEIAGHATACPICGAAWRRLGELRASLRTLGDDRVDADIASLIEHRLAPRMSPRSARRRNRLRWLELLPAGLGATAALATGAYLGLLLAGGSTVSVARPAAMAVFDVAPPGGLCAGLPSCYSWRR
jgi:anti-sigma factor RsiW